MDHEPQWESLIQEENQEDETDKLLPVAPTPSENEDDHAIESTVRSLLDSAPLSSVSEVTLNLLLDTTPLLVDNISEHEFWHTNKKKSKICACLKFSL